MLWRDDGRIVAGRENERHTAFGQRGGDRKDHLALQIDVEHSRIDPRSGPQQFKGIRDVGGRADDGAPSRSNWRRNAFTMK